LGPPTEEEVSIASPFAPAVLALAAWLAVHLVLLVLWRTPRSVAGTVPALTDPSMVQVLRALARHGSGERLGRDILTAAFSGLVRHLRLELDDRGFDGVWVRLSDRDDESLLGPHELALLERIRMTSVRAGGPVPLDSLRLAPEEDDAAWLRRTTHAAVGWARSVGLARDHVPAPARSLLRILLLVPVVLGTRSVVSAHALHDVGDLALAWAAAALAWWGVGRILVTPLRTVVLTEAGRAVLAAAPPPHEDVPAWVLSVLGTPAGRQPTWTAAGRSWRTVDVDRTGVRGGGERPGVALYASFLAGLLLLVAGIFLGVVTVGLLPTHPRTVLAEVGFGVVWAGWLYGMSRVVRIAARAVADLREGPERFVGRVVDRRQVAHGDDPDRYYVVVDEGSGSISTFLVTREQFSRAPEGGWVRISITPRLDHVADVELMTPTPSSSAVADMTLTLRRRRSRARDASV
jgi:hypothetical protein